MRRLLKWIPPVVWTTLLFCGCQTGGGGFSAAVPGQGSTLTGNPSTVAAVNGSPGAQAFLARSALEGFASLEDRSIGVNRFLVFTSRGDLLPTDTNGKRDVYLRDLRTGEMSLISVATDGSQGDGDSTQGSISADGRFVVFRSAATNLVAGDGNGVTDIFLRNIATGTTTRVSTATGGTEANGASLTPAVSANGRFVVFASEATNLVGTDGNGAQDIFLKDLNSGTTTLVSSNSAQTDSANGGSCDPAITAGTGTEGEFIAFSTEATDIVAGGLNGQRQVVRIERSTPANRVLVSQSAAAVQADAPCYEPSLSNDGNVVAFFTLATNLGASGDGNGFFDVYTRDISGNTTTCQSVNSVGNPGNNHSGYPSLSADGSTVAFGSMATDLVAGDGNGLIDVFRRSSGTTTLVSQATDGTAADSDSDLPGLSLDGRYTAFRSAASTLSPNDSTIDDDIFVRDSVTPDTFWATVSCLFPAIWPGFGTRAEFSQSGALESVVGGDFNNDGMADMGFVNRSNSTATVRLGDGAGGFSSSSTFSVGSAPTSVTAGDFNGDGDLDLATCNQSDNTVSVLLGDETGSFSAATNFSVGTLPVVVLSLDLDGDGNLDLATCNRTGDNVSVLLGNGAGGFGTASNFAVGDTPSGMVFGDFDGDGNPDLATSNYSSQMSPCSWETGQAGSQHPSALRWASRGLWQRPTSITTDG